MQIDPIWQREAGMPKKKVFSFYLQPDCCRGICTFSRKIPIIAIYLGIGFAVGCNVIWY